MQGSSIQRRKDHGKLAVYAAALAALGLAGSASAAILDDSATGFWDVNTTWGGSTMAAGDTLTIDSHTVNFVNHPTNGFDSTVSIPAIAGINLSGTGKFYTQSNLFPTQANRIAVNFNGGTWEASRTTFGAGGVDWNISGTTTFSTPASGENVTMGGAGVATSLVITGSGTINKTGNGVLSLASIANVADGDSGTPGNQPRINASTFSGIWNVDAGTLLAASETAEFTKFSTVNLMGTVAGTIVGTNLGDSPRVQFASGTYAGGQPEIKNLTGTGRVSWGNTSGYYRDVAVGTLLDPGTASEAGLIKKNDGSTSNDLVMRPGSTMAFDVFSASSADKVEWFAASGTAGMVFGEANLDVRLFTPAESTGPLSWTLIQGDEWISKSSQGTSSGTAIADQAFADIDFLNAAGTAEAPLYIAGTQSGWTNLAITYGGTSGSSNRTVILTGEYIAVPEPASASILVLGGMALSLRRTRRGRTVATGR